MDRYAQTQIFKGKLWLLRGEQTAAEGGSRLQPGHDCDRLAGDLESVTSTGASRGGLRTSCTRPPGQASQSATWFVTHSCSKAACDLSTASKAPRPTTGSTLTPNRGLCSSGQVEPSLRLLRSQPPRTT